MSDQILIVEDEPQIRQGLALDLEQRGGYTVVAAENGKEACAILESEHDFMAIISDEMMPEMSGFDLCRSVKAKPSLGPIPFIFITARTKIHEFVAGYELGACAYIRKPYNHAELIVQLDRHIANYKKLLTYQGKLMQTQKMALLGRLTSGVAHDLKNILTGANLCELISADIDKIYTLIEPKSWTPETWETLKNIKENALLIFQSVAFGDILVRNLLSFCRNGTKTAAKDCLLKPLIEESLAILSRRFRSCGIDLVLRLEDGAIVICYEDEMRQLILNLLVNAIDAVKGSPERFVIVRIWTQVEQTFLSVGDTGCGIPENIRPRIFDDFFTTRAMGGGTGLGLATVRRIVDACGGKIDLQTEVGKGTTFTVAFPAKKQ